MAKKKAEEAPVKTDGWMSTFSDLMNLLLCFFVLLFAMSTVDSEKWQQLVASFSSSYNILEGGGEGIEEGMLIASGASQLTELSEYYNSMGLGDKSTEEEVKDALIKLEEEQIKESESMEEFIEKILKNKGMSDAIDVQASQHYVVLNMKGSLLFEPAAAELTQDAMKVLSVVGDILLNYEDNLVEIEGHTDNVPIEGDPIFTSNDVLSDYRALAVFNFLVQDKQVSPKNLKHSGRGEYDPKASNDTAEGRAQNRRVEIKIYNSYSSH